MDKELDIVFNTTVTLSVGKGCIHRANELKNLLEKQMICLMSNISIDKDEAKRQIDQIDTFLKDYFEPFINSLKDSQTKNKTSLDQFIWETKIKS